MPAIFDCTTVNPLCEGLHQQSQVFPHPAASSQSKDRLSFHAVVAESKEELVDDDAEDEPTIPPSPTNLS